MPLYETSVTGYLLFLIRFEILEGRINPGIIFVFEISVGYKHIAGKHLKINCPTKEVKNISSQYNE